MASKLNYRLFQEADLPGLLQLWAENTSWGSLSEQTWREWYMNTPYGDCIVAVAEDEEGATAAQLVLTPCRVAVGAKEGLGAKLSAPILRKDLRSPFRTDHPIVELLNLATDAAKEQGTQLIYTLPEPSWLPLFQYGSTLRQPNINYQTTKFPCMAIAFDDVSEVTGKGLELTSAPVQATRGSEYEELWRQAVDSWPLRAAVARHPDWLSWKHCHHLVIEIRKCATGTLVGYGVVNRTTGLLMDLLAVDQGHVELVLQHTLWQASKHYMEQPSRDVLQLKVMAIPALRPELQKLGLSQVSYSFPFGIHWVRPGDSMTQDIDPENWYIMPGD